MAFLDRSLRIGFREKEAQGRGNNALELCRLCCFGSCAVRGVYLGIRLAIT